LYCERLASQRSFFAGKHKVKKASLMNPEKRACASSTHEFGALEKVN